MKKTPQQLEWILAEAERVNSVLVNDYTSLKAQVRELKEGMAQAQQGKEQAILELQTLKRMEASQKDDLERLNLIIEFEREQRFDWEQKNEMLVLAMNNTKITLINTEDKVKQQQETIRQQLESLQAKDELIEQHIRKINQLEEGMKGLKGNFDDTYRQYNEGKAQLEAVESEKEQYLQKLSTAKQELAQARETVSEMETRVTEHQKLMEMEQTHRHNLETQMDDLQKHNRRLVQQVAEVTGKEKATEKTIDELKMQIEQLERVRDHLTQLLDKDKATAKGHDQSPATVSATAAVTVDHDEKKLKSSQEREITLHLRSELEGKNKSIETLEKQMATLEHKYKQLESEKADLVSETNQLIQKLSEENNELRAKCDTTQNSGGKQEKEREWNNKIKAMEDALHEEREKVRIAEESIIDIRKKYRDELEQLQYGAENGNGTEEHDKAPNGLMLEQKLKQSFEEEKLELEKMTSTLSDNRTRYKEELEKFKVEKASLIDDLQRAEELKRDLEERELQVSKRREELQELEKQIEHMAVREEEISVAEKKLQAATKDLEEQKSTVESDKKFLEEEKAKIANEKLQTEQATKSLAAEKEQIEQEKKTLAEEKGDIDNELQRLVEQRLVMQQMKQEFEDKESHYLTKVEELSHSLAEERKQKEKLESKFSAGQKSPDAKDSLSFSYFKSRKTNKEKENEGNSTEGTPPLMPSENLTDEERKMKLFSEYQVLLTEINTTLFQKREQVSDIENNTGGTSILKKMGLGGLKSSVTKLEDLQGRVKKAFRTLDDKTSCSPTDEASEHVVLKAFRNELT